MVYAPHYNRGLQPEYGSCPSCLSDRYLLIPCKGWYCGKCGYDSRTPIPMRKKKKAKLKFCRVKKKIKYVKEDWGEDSKQKTSAYRIIFYKGVRAYLEYYSLSKDEWEPGIGLIAHCKDDDNKDFICLIHPKEMIPYEKNALRELLGKR